MLVIILGSFFALLWGILSGIVAFIVVWIWNPGLKLAVFVFYSIAPAIYAPPKTFLRPYVDIYARIFRQIHIKANFGGGIPIKLEGHTA